MRGEIVARIRNFTVVHEEVDQDAPIPSNVLGRAWAGDTDGGLAKQKALLALKANRARVVINEELSLDICIRALDALVPARLVALGQQEGP